MKFGLLWAHARAYRIPMAVAGAVMLLESVVTLLIPWLAMRLTDAAFARSGTGIPLVVLLLIGMLIAIQMSMRFLHGWLSGRLALRIGSDIRRQVFDHVQALPLARIHRQGQGDLMAMLTRETEALSQFIGSGILGLPMACLTAAAAVVLMCLLDPLFALLLLLLLPLTALLLRLPGSRMRQLATGVQREYARLLAIAGESLALLPLIKAFVREGWSSSRHDQQARNFHAASERQLLASSLLQPMLQFVAALGVLLLCALAAGRLAANSMTPGELTGFILYALVLMRPVSTMGLLYSQWQTTAGALQRLNEVLATPAEHAGGGLVLPACRGELQFEGLGFAYEAGVPVLDGLDLHIRAGEIVAIIGENGSGKSTLIDLLLRFRTPDRGRILLDGQDIATLDLHSLRRNIALVSQQAQFLDGSVRDNLAFGHPDATQLELEAAASLVGLHAHVQSLPQGYETSIGEQGARLSGGQRQRLALARALLKPAPILVLDEATAMLDPAGERQIVAGCRKALAGRTVILITHRPASLDLADRVLELRDGRIHNADTRRTHVARQACGL